MWCISPRAGPSSASGWADANLDPQGKRGWRRLLPFRMPSPSSPWACPSATMDCDGPISQLVCQIWTRCPSPNPDLGLAGHQPTLIAQQEPSQGILLGKKEALMLGEQIPLAA